MTPHSDPTDQERAGLTSPPPAREHPATDETMERVLGPEETLVKKPSTFDLKVPPDVKQEKRYGDALTGASAELVFVLRGYTSKTLEAEVFDTLVIGRRAAKSQERPDLDLSRYGGYISGVSRQHVRIIKDEAILTVTDLGSRNGTYLNGLKLVPNQPRILRDGDELCLGTLFLRVYFRNTLLKSDDAQIVPHH